MKNVTAKQVVTKLRSRLTPLLVRGGVVNLRNVCLDEVMNPRGNKGRYNFDFSERALTLEVKRQFPGATKVQVVFGEAETTSVYLTAIL